MDAKGEVVKIDLPGPNNGNLLLVVDWSDKAVSLVEVAPKMQQGTKVVVWEVQKYTEVAK